MAESWAERLLAVQEKDLRMRDIRARMELLPAERNKLIAKGRAAQARREEAKQKVRSTLLEIKSAESDIAAGNAAMTKLKQQSAGIKKNSEYQTMLGEIAACQTRIGDLESRQLELMDRVEEEKRAVGTVSAEVEAVIKGVKTELTEIDQFVLELRAEYKQLEAAAAAAARAVETGVLDTYRRLLKSGQGLPVAPVENGICGNCHLRLTPQTMNQVKSGQIATCDNCMHLVYMAPEA